jgi:hypothetical protein
MPANFMALIYDIYCRLELHQASFLSITVSLDVDTIMRPMLVVLLMFKGGVYTEK